jgi:hypothetical protein
MSFEAVNKDSFYDVMDLIFEKYFPHLSIWEESTQRPKQDGKNLIIYYISLRK